MSLAPDTLFKQGLLAGASGRGWLVLLAEGWRFSDDLVPAPLVGPHGHYAVLLWRHDAPAAAK